MSFAVLAALPLAAYRATIGGDSLDPLPTPARLHAALLCAASAGTRAVLDGDGLRPFEDDAAALAWIEEHPPDGVVIPPTCRVAMPLIAFRQEGVVKREGKAVSPAPKVRGKSLVGLVAVNGTFGWTWDDEPPARVVAALQALVRDVSHLGSSETPARLWLGDAAPTHRRKADASLLSAGHGALDLEVAAPGRTTALRAAYTASQTPPSLARDRWSSSEEPMSSLPTHAYKSQARYVPPSSPERRTPWTAVHVLALEHRGHADFDIPPERRVATAVSAHRALVKLVGFGAPAVLTGSYLRGAPRPANRIAIQVLCASTATAIGYGSASLLVMIPRGADPAEVDVVVDALRRLRRLTAQGLDVRYADARPGDDFWPFGDGTWVTEPAMVADTRPLTRKWTLEDTVHLAVGLVLRDQIQTAPGSGRLAGLAAAVAAGGCEVESAVKITEGKLGSYVHKTSPGAVVQPFRATLSTSLLPPRAIAALGQSRHLGGGLLVPAGAMRVEK